LLTKGLFSCQWNNLSASLSQKHHALLKYSLLRPMVLHVHVTEFSDDLASMKYDLSRYCYKP